MNTKQLVSELNGVTTDSYAVIKDGRVEIYAAYEEDEDEKNRVQYGYHGRQYL